MEENIKPKSNRIWLVIVTSIIGGLIGAAFVFPLLVARVPVLTDWAVGQLMQVDGDTEVIERTELRVVTQNDAIIEAVKKISPAVVSITEKTSTADYFGRIIEAEGRGTGFIATADGLIITNKHVVSGGASAGSEYTVVTHDGDAYAAVVKAVDPVNDIAILKIEGDNLPVVALGYADTLQVGQMVIAIGNAQGEFPNSVSLGIVSGVDRSITAADPVTGEEEKLEGMIQTDAGINEGNSGGPLVDLGGTVIGINTAIDAGAQQIAFAIPIDLVRGALESYLANGKIIRPQLGVRYISITPDFAEINDLPVDQGALVYSSDRETLLAVLPGSPADQAGIEEMDIITKINNDQIDDSHSLTTLVQRYQPGERVEVTYLRDGAEYQTVVILDISE